MAPAAAEPLGLEAHLVLGLLLEQVQGEACETGEVLGSVALADAAVVVTKAEVQAPVQAILHAPMPADVSQQFGGLVRRQAADIVAVLAAGLAVDGPPGFDADEAAQEAPL